MNLQILVGVKKAKEKRRRIESSASLHKFPQKLPPNFQHGEFLEEICIRESKHADLSLPLVCLY